MLHALHFTPGWMSLQNVINIREEYNNIRVVWYVFDQRFSPSRVMELTVSPHIMAAFPKLCSAIPWSSVCYE